MSDGRGWWTGQDKVRPAGRSCSTVVIYMLGCGGVKQAHAKRKRSSESGCFCKRVTYAGVQGGERQLEGSDRECGGCRGQQENPHW